MTDVADEIIRLKKLGITNICVEEDIKRIAELTLEINKLKKEKNAVIAAHVHDIARWVIREAMYGG